MTTTNSPSTSPTPTPPTVTGVTAHVCVRDANAAADLYQRAFGAEVLQRLAAPDGKLMHCHLRINGGNLFINDAFPEHGCPLEAPQSFALHLQVDNADAWWKRAVDGGLTITTPIDLAFWGDRYGQLRDPFGVTWSIGGPNR
jgi:PhnB protein